MRQAVKARRHSHHSHLRTRRKYSQLIVALLFFVSILFVLNYFLRNPAFQIRSVEVSGTNFILENDVKEFVQSKISGSMLGLVPRSNAFLLGEGSIEDELKEKFKRIDEVEVREEKNVVYVDLSERAQAYVSCNSRGECNFVDKAGFAFATAASSTRSLYPTFISRTSNEPSAEELKSRSAIVELLANIGIETREIVPDGEVDAILVTKAGWRIKYPEKGETGDILKRLGLALESDALAGDKLSTLDYIDLRFGNKIFYKYK